MDELEQSALDTVEAALEEIRNGKIVIVCDSADRENEGDLVMAASCVTPAAVNFMARYGRGLICCPVAGERLDQLGLGAMVTGPGDQLGTAFTVSVDARHGTTTGISAAERAHTILTIIDPGSGPGDLLRPGHVFPLRARPGGVLARPGHTEAAVDLAVLAGHEPAGVICEILNEDGTMARVPQLLEFARRHGLKIISIEDLIRYRLTHEKAVDLIAETSLPTKYGRFLLKAYEERLSGDVHLALIKGDPGEFAASDVLVRVHSQCLTGDVLGSLRCDCGLQFEGALEMVEHAGQGVFLYMRQEGRGIGLGAKIKAYQLQDHGYDTVEANEMLGYGADQRDYGIAAQILKDIGVRRLRLISNNPLKLSGLQLYGLEVTGRVPLEIAPSEYNLRYLTSKRDRLGHSLHLDPAEASSEPRGAGASPAHWDNTGADIKEDI